MSALPITHRAGRPDLGTTAATGAAGRTGAAADGAVRVPYGRPVIKAPVWKPEVPLYFYAGGVAGGSAAFAYAAHVTGDRDLARRAWAVALAGAAVSPALLISDLGVPARFLHMLRVFKVTSPMSVGSWLLSGLGATTGAAALHAWTGLLPGVAAVARPAAAALGLPVCTYTAALIADTAVPVWHDARGLLPFVFAASAAASTGAAVALATAPGAVPAAARALMLGGGLAEVAAATAMERRLGALGAPYHEGASGRLARAAKALTLAGAVGAAGRGAAVPRFAAALTTAGAICERFAVFTAGFASAGDPAATVRPQRDAIARGLRRGASRLRARSAEDRRGSPATAPVELPAAG